VAIAMVITLIVAAVWGLGQVVDLLSPVLGRWRSRGARVPAVAGGGSLSGGKIPSGRAIILVFILALAVIAGVLASVIPQWWWKRRTWRRKFPEYSRNFRCASMISWRIPGFLRHFLPPPRARMPILRTAPTRLNRAGLGHELLTGSLPEAARGC